MENFIIKEEISRVEDMCSVYINEEHKVIIKEEMCTIYLKEEDIKMENTEIQGYWISISLLNIILQK